MVKRLRVAAAFIKTRAADMMKGWDDKVIDVPLITMIKEDVERVPRRPYVSCCGGCELVVKGE